jgi:hypothetical protein
MRLIDAILVTAGSLAFHNETAVFSYWGDHIFGIVSLPNQTVTYLCLFPCPARLTSVGVLAGQEYFPHYATAGALFLHGVSLDKFCITVAYFHEGILAVGQPVL